MAVLQILFIFALIMIPVGYSLHRKKQVSLLKNDEKILRQFQEYYGVRSDYMAHFDCAWFFVSRFHSGIYIWYGRGTVSTINFEDIENIRYKSRMHPKGPRAPEQHVIEIETSYFNMPSFELATVFKEKADNTYQKIRTAWKENTGKRTTPTLDQHIKNKDKEFKEREKKEKERKEKEEHEAKLQEFMRQVAGAYDTKDTDDSGTDKQGDSAPEPSSQGQQQKHQSQAAPQKSKTRNQIKREKRRDQSQGEGQHTAQWQPKEW